MSFQVGQPVKRVEPRARVVSRILAIDEQETGTLYLLAYDEGGSGWWPETALKSLGDKDPKPKNVKAKPRTRSSP